MDLLLSEQIVLLGYDEEKGRAGLFESMAPVLAGAVLLDLVGGGQVREVADRIEPVPNAGRPSSTAAAELLSKIEKARAPKKAKHWVSGSSLTSKLERKVAEDLAARGVLRKERRRFLGVVPETRFPEADPEPERALRAPLHAVLLSGAEPTGGDALLVGLLRAGQMLDKVVPRDRRKDARRRAEEIEDSGDVATAVDRTLKGIQAAVIAAVATSAATGGADGGGT